MTMCCRMYAGCQQDTLEEQLDAMAGEMEYDPRG